MAIGNKAKETKSTKTDNEVLGYWNPRGLVSKEGEVVHKFKTQFGIALYADDPVHVALFNAAQSKDAGYEFWISGVINANAPKEDPKDIPWDSL